MKRRIPVMELAICGFAFAVQIAAAILVRKTFLHREFRHDVPPWFATLDRWCWIAPVVTAALVAVLALARPPQLVWSLIASLSCLTAIALYVGGYYL